MNYDFKTVIINCFKTIIINLFSKSKNEDIHLLSVKFEELLGLKSKSDDKLYAR